MTTAEFRRQARAIGLSVRKRKNLEVLEVHGQGTHLAILYADLYGAGSIEQIMAKRAEAGKAAGGKEG